MTCTRKFPGTYQKSVILHCLPIQIGWYTGTLVRYRPYQGAAGLGLGWKRDLHNAIIFSDIRRHFISFGKVRKEICINLPTTTIALDDGCARQKTRKTNETTRQLLRFFCRSGLEVVRPDDGALAFTRVYAQTVRWHGHFYLKYARARNDAHDTRASA